jgi:Mn-dependent DtxR family transcriptional regulator
MYESGENYLETVLMLFNQNGYVRAVDVARKLNVSRPSVSHAMGLLKHDGYIEFEGHSPIILTPKGKEAAEKIYARHRTLTAFLALVSGVPLDQAEENACRMEHIIDKDVFEGIIRFMNGKVTPAETAS